MAKRVVFNQKGGVGKTTITCNLAAAMAKAGRKTLVIDLDSQANASQYLLGPELKQKQESIADFFESTLSFKIFKNSLKDCVYPTPYKNLWIIPADRALTELQPKLESRYKIFKLREAVDELVASDNFDQVFFDTPPALNFYTMSALMASDKVLVPFDCDAFSAEALEQVREVVDDVRADHQPDLSIEGVVINHFQPQARLPIQAIKEVAGRGFRILKPYLSTSIAVRESHAVHTPMIFQKPGHKLSREYSELAAGLDDGRDDTDLTSSGYKTNLVEKPSKDLA
jgi:chromosome partitioning protein